MGLARRCPDCVAAEPVVDAAFARCVASGKTVTLIRCPVLRAEYKGNPDFPYRKHAQIMLTAVPTLIRWGPRDPVDRAVDDQCVNAELLDTMMGRD